MYNKLKSCLHVKNNADLSLISLRRSLKSAYELAVLCEGDFDERMFLERELSGEIVATHKMRDMDRLVSYSHDLSGFCWPCTNSISVHSYVIVLIFLC